MGEHAGEHEESMRGNVRSRGRGKRRPYVSGSLIVRGWGGFYTTTFTSLPGTTITFLGVLPFKASATFGLARASAFRAS